MTDRFLTRSVLLLVAMAPSLAQGQTPQWGDPEEALLAYLNTPVACPTKRVQRLVDSPQSVEVLTGEEIRQMGIRRLQDALKLMTGVDVLEAGNGFTAVGIRGPMGGGQPKAVRILVDGTPMDNALTGGVDLNNLPVPLEAIDRVEVLRGPNGTLYGAGAEGGVIAITTKGSGRGVHGDLSGSKADRNTGRHAGSLSIGDGRWGLFVAHGGASMGPSGDVVATVGSPLARTTLDLTASDASHQTQDVVKAEWNSERTQAWVSVGSASKTQGPMGTGVDYRRTGVTTVQASLTRWWGPTISTELRAHQVSQGLWLAASPAAAQATGDPGFLAEYHAVDLATSGVEALAKWDPEDGVHLVFGAEGQQAKAKGPVPFLGLVADTKTNVVGGYVAGDWAVAEGWTLSAGVRAERATLGGPQLSPSASLVWRVSEGGALRASYRVATRTPQILEANVDLIAAGAALPGNGAPVVLRTLPNPGLKAERTEGAELGYRQAFGRLSFDVAAFSMAIRKPIERMDLPAGPVGTTYEVPSRYLNAGDATSRGVEASFAWNAGPGRGIGANTTLQNVTRNQVAAGDPLEGRFTYAPKTKSNLWARYRTRSGRLNAYLGFWRVGPADVEALRSTGANLFGRREGYARYDSNLSLNLSRGLYMSVYVRGGGGPDVAQGASGWDGPTQFLTARREGGMTLGFHF
jgi:iron complex outermembrane receptor protein